MGTVWPGGKFLGFDYGGICLVKAVNKHLWIKRPIIELFFHSERGSDDAAGINGFQRLFIDGRDTFGKIDFSVNAFKHAETGEIDFNGQPGFFRQPVKVFDKLKPVSFHLLPGVFPQAVKKWFAIR